MAHMQATSDVWWGYGNTVTVTFTRWAKVTLFFPACVQRLFNVGRVKGFFPSFFPVIGLIISFVFNSWVVIKTNQVYVNQLGNAHCIYLTFKFHELFVTV
jgi:hypothetical protein